MLSIGLDKRAHLCFNEFMAANTNSTAGSTYRTFRTTEAMPFWSASERMLVPAGAEVTILKALRGYNLRLVADTGFTASSVPHGRFV